LIIKILLEKIVLGQPPAPEDKVVVEDNRFGSFDDNFGIHVLEHILLRPLYQQDSDPLSQLLPLCGDGTNNKQAACLLPDNYSMQLTIVAPGWLAISNNMDFRSFTESLMRTEAPAHAAIKICWLDPAMMFLFEKTTEAFFAAMAIIKIPGANPTAQNIIDFNTALNDVNTMMGLLKNMYLPSSLNECENINYNADEDLIKVPVILNYSALGSDGTDEWFAYNKPESESNTENVTEKTPPVSNSEATVQPLKKTSKSKAAVEKKQPVLKLKNTEKKIDTVSKSKKIIEEKKPVVKKVKAIKKAVVKQPPKSAKTKGKVAVKKAAKKVVKKIAKKAAKKIETKNKKQAKKKNK